MAKLFQMAPLRVLSDIISRAGLASRAGITFGGKRDLYEALGYQRVLRPTDFRSRYERNGIARRVARAYPEATWRGGAELVEDQDPQVSTPFEEAWVALNDRIGVWAALSRLDVLVGLGRYAVLLIGAPGNLSEELQQMSSQEDVLYLQAYGEDEAVITTYEEDPENARFGLPTMYTLSRRAISGAMKQKAFSVRVHWTRLIHVAEDTLDDRVFGDARLAPVWNFLDDLEKVSGGGSEAFWLRVHQGLLFNLEKDVEMSEPDVQKTKEQMDEFVHQMRRTMLTRGMEVTPLGSDVSNFANQLDGLLGLVSGSTGIPKRILMGSERGELASTQDRENWDTRVTDRRSDYAEPMIVRPLVNTLIEHGALPAPTEYEVRWPEIESLTQNERSTIAKDWSGLSKSAGGPVVLPAEIRDRVLRLEPLSPEQLMEFEGKQAVEDEKKRADKIASINAVRKERGLKPLPEDADPTQVGADGTAPGEQSAG